MTHHTLLRSALAAAAAHALAAVPATPIQGGRGTNAQVPTVRRSTANPVLNLWAIMRGPGWSYAHVKRMARKRRNVLRNRRHHRGR